MVIEDSALAAKYLQIANIDDTPVDAETQAPISSNWAYDHLHDNAPHSNVGLDDLDDCGTLSGSILLGMLLFGSGNAQYYPCILQSEYGHFSWGTPRYENIATGTVYLHGTLSLPTMLGGKKLYITHMRVGVYDADATDYVTEVALYGANGTSFVREWYNDSNKETPNDYEYTFPSPIDMSSYDRVHIRLVGSCTIAKALDISYINLKCYYA